MAENQQQNDEEGPLIRIFVESFNFLDGLGLFLIIVIEIGLLIGMLLCSISGSVLIYNLFIEGAFTADSFSIRIIGVLERFLLAVSLFIISRGLHEIWGYRVTRPSQSPGENQNWKTQFHTLERSIFTSICLALIVFMLDKIKHPEGTEILLHIVGIPSIIVAMAIFLYASSKQHHSD